MKRVLTALILVPVVLILVFLGPGWQWLFTLAVAVVAAAAAWEFAGLAEKSGAQPPRVAVVLAVLALFALNAYRPSQLAAILGILSLALLLYCTFFRPVDQMLADASTAIFGFFYAGFTLTALPALIEETNGPSLVAFLLCVVWAGDIAALYTGRAWGRHKLAPWAQPQQNLGGRAGLSGRQPARHRLPARTFSSTADVGYGRPLVSRKRPVLADAGRSGQRGSTGGRSG